jgi:hypothetical protein
VPFFRLSRRHSTSFSRHNWRFNSGGGKAVISNVAPRFVGVCADKLTNDNSKLGYCHSGFCYRLSRANAATQRTRPPTEAAYFASVRNFLGTFTDAAINQSELVHLPATLASQPPLNGTRNSAKLTWLEDEPTIKFAASSRASKNQLCWLSHQPQGA